MTWTPAAVHHPALAVPARRVPVRRPGTAAPHRDSHGGRAGLRLTRRGRAVLLLALVVLLLAAFSLGRVGSQAAPRGARQAAPLAQTTVHQGETLWSVARRVAPGTDPRAVVRRLQELNHLDGAGVRAGQQLLLPR
jgi:hypothetical protein